MWISKDEVSSPSGSVCSLPMHINVQRYNCFPVYVLLSVLLGGHHYFYVKSCFTCLACKFFFLVLCTAKSLLWTAVSSYPWLEKKNYQTDTFGIYFCQRIGSPLN